MADRPSSGNPTDTTQMGATEEREVSAADPALSAATNARVTEELRDVVGADRVRVPAERPRASRGEQPHPRHPIAYLTAQRLDVLRGFAIVLTFGAIVALITRTWWLLPVAAGVHALGTMTVVMSVLRLTTVTERPSPEVGAAMAEEGVSSPDERFSRMVDEFAPASDRGTGTVLSPGHNERTVSAGADPLRAAAEQSSAMTPTAEPSRPGGEGGTPDFLIWATAASLLIVSIIVPLLEGGGWMWLLPAIMVPLLIGWVVLQAVMVNRGDAVQVTSRRPLVAVVLCTAVAVAVFCAVVALAYQH